MSEKISISLIIIALLTLLVGFNVSIFIENEVIISHVYGLCDSLAWTIFSLSFYLQSIEYYKVNKSTIVWYLRLVCELFMVLSVCPLVNEFGNIADIFQYNNYIYGIIVLLFYLAKLLKSLITYERCKK